MSSSMYRVLRCALFAAAVTVVQLSPVSSQEATELYIPIGQSPGLSTGVTVIGEIVEVDHEASDVVVESAGETYRIHIDDTTRIYVDRSHLQEPNYVGTLSNCQRGLRVEAKPRPDQEGDSFSAQWVKVRPED